ncbi:glucan biosynthesis protein [Opitutus sp. ER46]|uniref:glucan biosynthesis protein n=1 Tax=Opitutus sp. ER46 TaxID=2161864 RepID=UPI000D2F5173|nr:glucan biosynthesis protein [Opitutus sp. ER46]PTX94238.1 glucan biosynthesis protein D [Opitutus sp. ER46]
MKRLLLFLLAVGATVLAPSVRAADDIFDFEVLRYQAKMLANRPYALPPPVPDWLLKLSYDQHRLIQFNAGRSLWRREALPFQVQFFHPGYIFNRQVRVNTVERRHVRPVPFDRDFFNYDTLQVGALPANMGFAGVRLLYPLNHPGDELGVFLGASYFRFLCERAFYGLSARGLALNTGVSGPEEFPVFTEFWIERPTEDAKVLTVYALLDSPSATGAFRFVITPGADTVMHVRTAIYFRADVGVVGMAPLTSMFWRGENAPLPTQDFRPEVHDSDGLQLFTGSGEWLWRPLRAVRAPHVAMFGDENPRGFGLMQRDRNFENYQDLEAHYHLRPSAWVEPVGNWGRGAVRLLELPTENEFNDNIVACWVPEKLPPHGEALLLEYRLHWCLDQFRPPAGLVIGTRHGHSPNETGLERFVVDFDGTYLSNQRADPAIEPVLTVGEGAKLVHSALHKNIYNGSWRVSFALQPDGTGRPVELRCFLRKPPHVLTETWSYLWQP